MTADTDISVDRAILIQEVTILKNRLEELGSELPALNDEAILNANLKTLRGWKRDFSELIRTISAGRR